MNPGTVNLVLGLSIAAITVGIFLNPAVARQAMGIRLVATTLISAFLTWFFFYVLWPFVPLGLFVTTSSARQPDGVVIGGIPWSDKYREVHVRIANNSDMDIQAIDLVIRPDQPVAAVGEVTSLDGVSFAPYSQPSVNPQWVEATGERMAIPVVPLAASRGYRLRCNVLPKRSHLEMVMAAVTVNESGDGSGADMVFRINFRDGQSVWLAHNGHSNAVFGPKPTVVKISVTGQYTVADRQHNVSRTLSAADFVKAVFD